MKIETDTSFGRDAKKLSDLIRHELNVIYEATEQAQSLGDLTYSVKKWKEVGSLKHSGCDLLKTVIIELVFI